MIFDVEKDLEFRQLGNTGKTDVFNVWNLKQNTDIGIVKWHPAWRHYCFFPDNDTVFSDRCLLRIGEFILKLNEKHKEKATAKAIFNDLDPIAKAAWFDGSVNEARYKSIRKKFGVD